MAKKKSEETSAETITPGEGTGADPAEGNAPPKRTVRRRPMWVCVPTVFVETSPPAGEDALPDQKPNRTPDKYSIYRCMTKDDVRDILKKHVVDPTNIGEVLMFRADPVKFEISQQINIKF